MSVISEELFWTQKTLIFADSKKKYLRFLRESASRFNFR